MKFRMFAAGLIALTLTGCVSPVMLRNPASGEVTQCLAAGAFPLINQQQCVASYENLGWLRTTAPEARQAQQQRIVQRDDDAANCHARYPAERGTYQALADCLIRVSQSQWAADPAADLYALHAARGSAVAAKVDQGTLSPSQAQVEIAESWADVQQRLLQRRQVQAQIAVGNSTAKAADAAAMLLQTEMTKPYQVQMPVIETPARYRPTQTNCNSYGTSINCTTY
jgi:hypothetical protein